MRISCVVDFWDVCGMVFMFYVLSSCVFWDWKHKDDLKKFRSRLKNVASVGFLLCLCCQKSWPIHVTCVSPVAYLAPESTFTVNDLKSLNSLKSFANESRRWEKRFDFEYFEIKQLFSLLIDSCFIIIVSNVHYHLIYNVH
jgi:hypothetical protein